jgi:hypothetical protein
MVQGLGWRTPITPRCPRQFLALIVQDRTSKPGVALPIEPGRIGNSFELLPTTRLHSVWPNTSWASTPGGAHPAEQLAAERLTAGAAQLHAGCLTSACRISFSAVGGRNTLRMP